MHLETVPHRRHLKGLTESWRCWRGFWHDMQLQVCKAFAFKKKRNKGAYTSSVHILRTYAEGKENQHLPEQRLCLCR